ncbi:MAG: response regulator [Dissulfurimicrobium sp.]|uniref:response regulator n=1 Tax=Dissulfurimicrobium TaxID=1769732 RepID=UPI001EDB2CAD|nr:response regulator [Dissulfurimicrobium hydrothermale]UKL12917.1 response regulator [Dissulfurimicrobium hydrothermale]
MKQNQTILLADTSERIRRQFQTAAERLKLRLILAEDGQEALDLAVEKLPDLIVIRRNAAVLDALSFSVLLKQSANTKDIPVIIICTEASTQERERFKDAGCCGCLEEPFSDQRVIEILERWLP